ncbi:GntR family transcriptional regulator [Aureimonas endophytica]|uniref:GntR family transcriptional regulator n=1 Tax=Aureimonas endophytica TaxID=2027858 RepID=A0A916ZEA0_9HYPH|nr:PLP-dependent aminotransferase family protein [Aureimonas endophytica]GGD91492.1 GntR family transcriptional regulator [Aureimonas endophytica]
MTKWTITPAAGDGPYYVRLAEAIEQAVEAGAIASGDKLPPQRNLAYDLGVTIGTIGRAYSLLRERGIVSGEVGRGTYILGQDTTSAPGAGADHFSERYAGTRHEEAPRDKLRLDTTAAPDIGQGPAIGAVLAAIVTEHPLEVASYSRSHPAHWLEAGQRWLSRNGWSPAPECVVPTHGAHAAALAVVSAVTAAGDRIAFEALTYSQLSRATRLIGRRTAIVACDEQGMVPEDFERVCAQQHPKLAFLMPAAQNPTLAVLPEERRRAIAEIARRHGVWLIEDEIYGVLSEDPTPLVASFAPERTFVVGGLSKSVAAGVRGGWVACPPHFARRLKVTHKMTTGGISFVLAEAGARLVLSGAADEIRRSAIAEIRERQGLAETILAGYDVASHPQLPFLWLKLPEPWLSGTFKNAALREDILIDDEDEFKADRLERTFHRVRIAFSSSGRREVEAGLRRLRRLLDSGAAGYGGED